MSNNYVLAMYDVRGKQDYIFSGNKLKEIVGGSLVIRDIFKDELFPAAEKYAKNHGLISNNDTSINNEKNECIYNYKDYEYKDEAVHGDNDSEEKEWDFSEEKFEKHLKDGYLGEVVYDGGGNFFILYKDEEVCKGINRIFTKSVMEHTYSLTVLCSYIVGVDFENYTTICPEGIKLQSEEKGDREKLYAVNRKREAIINPQIPAQVLPFTQVDYASSLPLYKTVSLSETNKRKVTRESFRKYKKFKQIKDSSLEESKAFDEKILDNIASEKGTDSWIAVIYIDGNNMGVKVKNILGIVKKEKIKVTYKDAIKKLRDFSNDIQKNYIDDRLKAIDDALEKKYENNGEKLYKRRFVIYAGDEINIILNAHDAYDAIKAYFKGVPDENGNYINGMPEGNSACAGVAIFKSHTPYSDAYRIAEECCETGKKLMKKNNMGEVCYLDFHYCQGAIGTDLKNIRKREVGKIISKPWIVQCENDKSLGEIDRSEVITCDMVDHVVELLNECSRTNIKGLLDCALRSENELYSELERMWLRRKKQPDGQNNSKSMESITRIKGYDEEYLSNDKLRKLIYDIVSVYDLWFRVRRK